MDEEIFLDFINAVAHMRRLQGEVSSTTTPLGLFVLKRAEERVDELLGELTNEKDGQ